MSPLALIMGMHPEIELVSRDRGGDYASAATVGAPQAVQCADRFHLLKNLGEALEGLLAHHLARQRRREARDGLDGSVSLAEHPKRAKSVSPKVEHLQRARREERLARYEQVIALHKQGVSQIAIAQQVRISHRTVQRWLASGTFPEKKPREQGSHIDPYLPYLFLRWEEGCHTMARLFRELAKQGYKGSYAILSACSQKGERRELPACQGPPHWPPPDKPPSSFFVVPRS